LAKIAAGGPDARHKMRVHMNLDRRLWWTFKSRVYDRGETLTGRIETLIRRDLKEPAAEPAPAPVTVATPVLSS
jgi:hypothetical protein